MEKTLIDNSEQRTMQRALHDFFNLPELQTVRIATGYWDLKGLVLVKDDLRTFLEKDGTQLQLLIGKDPYIYASQITNPKYKNKDYPNDFIRTDIEDLDVADAACKEVVALLLEYCQAEEPKFDIHIYTSNQEEAQFLHSKCYIFESSGNGGARAIIGSSNFTKKGLEENSELNYIEDDYIKIAGISPNAHFKSFVEWFNEKWAQSESWSQQFIEQVLDPTPIAQEVKKEQEEHEVKASSLSPYEAYIRLLNDKFGALTNDDMEAVLESYLPKKIKPFKFQMDAAILCHQVMHQHGGFLLGDVVGLGKTIVGVLVLKYYLDTAEDEGRARKALIIVPPAIKSSWEKTIAQFDEDKEDKIAQYVDFVTTGSIGKLVEEGDDDVEEESEDFSEELKHEPYGLIIIDESHNFRNRGTQKYEMLEDLIEEINLQAGYYPYIGLLSATIQNNSPEDLRNQIYLFQRHPKESTLAVEGHNLDYFFVQACDRYRKIISEHPTGEQEKQTNQNALIYLSQNIHDKVLAELLVRRTRTDIKNDYKEDLDFPVIKGPVKLEYKMNRRLSQLFYDSMELIAPKPEAINLGEPGIVYMRYRATEYLNSELQKRYSGRNMSPEKSSSHLARIMQMLLVKRLEQAVAALDELMVSLDETEIKAPFAGIVTAKYVEEGSMISQGTPLFALQDPLDNWVNFKIPETELGHFHLHQTVELLGRDEKTRLSGEVVDISSKSEFATQRATSERGDSTDIISFNVKIQVDSENLHPGMRFRLLENSL